MDTQEQETIGTEPQTSQTETASTTLVEKPKKDSNLIVVASLGLFVIAALTTVMFLFNQNQKLKSMLADYQTQPSPTPTATADPTADWQLYEEETFSIKLPSTWSKDAAAKQEIRFMTSRDTSAPSGGDYTPGFADITIYSGSDVEGFFGMSGVPVDVVVDGIGGQQLGYYGGIAGSVYTLKTVVKGTTNAYSIILTTQDESMKDAFVSEYNQILSTFKFIKDGGTACTQDAKLCSDGSYVGRVGPSCEFAACP